ncbi:MAG TPA: response regulator, partial [Vicinamibacterales bacterium]|nr:response regulator [Vicinamibacterales bacterium]
AQRAASTGGDGTAAYVSEAERWLPAERFDSRTAADTDAATDNRARVLVADDNADMRDYAARLLDPYWTVETVGDGRQALQSVAERPPDLVLTDIMMPDLDGFGLLAALRGNPATAHIPVIMLSARAGDEARVEGLESGADDYLVKPFSARELIARVGIHVGLARARRQAVEERDRMRRLLGDVPAIINFLTGPDLVFEFAHPMTAATLGGRDVVGKPLVDAIPELRDQPFVDLLRSVYETGQPQSGRTARARLDQSNDGTLDDTYWDFTYVPVRSATGRIEGVMTFDIDVTDRVRTQRQVEEHTAMLETTRERLEHATRAKDEFLAMLGHELRNPLAPILTALQLMQLKGATHFEKEREVIERQTRHLVRLVDDLLDVSRIARGKIELKKQRVETGVVVARAIEIASPLLEARNQRLDVDVPSAGLTVDADPERLAQAVANLLTNAAKYTEPSGHIRVQAARDGTDVVIAVRDDGIGMAAEALPHIFDLFVQERQALDRAHGGLGLGLAIVRSIMTLHGGTADASSDGPGRGSEFRLRLPAVATAIAPAPPAVEPALQISDAHGVDILVVDDNEDAAALMADALRLAGHRVRVAYDGPDALDAVAAFTPRIALLDIGLPGMDGYELATNLRRQRGLEQVRLVAITGYGQLSDRKRATQAGFDAHLVKPVHIDALDRLIRELVEGSSAHRVR